MPPSWDDLASPTERTNLKRRLHRVWTSDLSLDEIVDEMAICLRCRFKPGTEYRCEACRGDPKKPGCTVCGGCGRPAPCGLCAASGVMGGMTLEVILAMAAAMNLPEERQCESYIPTEAEIRLACARRRMEWSDAQREAAWRGTLNSAGDNHGESDRDDPESPRRGRPTRRKGQRDR